MSEKKKNGSNTLLIVEDDDALRSTLVEHWTSIKANFKPVFVDTAESALRTLAAQSVDIVLTDLHLPDATGLFLMSEINRRYPMVKVVMMTSRPTEETKSKAMSLGAVDFITKPFDLNKLDILLTELGSRETTGLSGVIKQISLADLVQLKCATRVKVKILFNGMGEEGVLFFNNGIMTYAKSGALEGPEAFYRIFAWKRGSFEEVPFAGDPEVNLPKNWEGLLLEAAQRKDENIVPTDEEFEDAAPSPSSSAVHQPPPPPPAPVPAKEAISLNESELPPAEDAVFKLSSLPYVTGVLLSSRSGSLLQSNIEDRPNKACAMAAFLTQQGHVLAQILGQKSVREVYVKTLTSQRLVLPRASMLVGVVTGPDFGLWPERNNISKALNP